MVTRGSGSGRMMAMWMPVWMIIGTGNWGRQETVVIATVFLVT